MSNPIKICFVAPKAYPLFNPAIEEVFGGIEVDLYLLATELAKDKEYDVHFITADYGQNHTETIQQVKITKSVDFAQNTLWGAGKIWKAMKNIRADIYFQEGASSGTLLVGLFCYIHHKIFVYRTAHKNHCDGTYIKEHPFLGRIIKWLLPKSPSIIVQNESDCADIKNTMNVFATVIRNGQYIPEPSKKNGKFILWIGRSAGFKRPESFLSLTKLFPDQKFLMICQKAFNDEDYKILESSAKNIPNLEFINRIPFDETENYFRLAKIYVNTSESEGFANTFVQACKCATPILSLRVNPDDFLNRYQCGMCAEGDWERFVSQFQQLQDPETAKRYGESGRKYAEEHHDIRKIIEQYKNIFQSLMDKKQEKTRQ